MGQINWGRVVLGGLVAGLIINIGESLLNMVVFADVWEGALEGMGIEPVGGIWIAVFVVLGFVGGIVLACLYASMRPRFGPGALIAGGVMWFLAWFWPSITMAPMFAEFLPAGTMVLGLILTLIEVELAALAAGWLYQEGAAAGGGAAAQM
jgi:hypothetical protein